MSTTTQHTDHDDDRDGPIERMRRRTEDPWLERALELAQSGKEAASS
jgi:hypothetical protein